MKLEAAAALALDSDGIKSLQAQKVPAHAIGSQAHISVSTSFETMDQALTDIAGLGLPIHVTELDVNSTAGGQRSFSADIPGNAVTTQGGLVSDGKSTAAFDAVIAEAKKAADTK